MEFLTAKGSGGKGAAKSKRRKDIDDFADGEGETDINTKFKLSIIQSSFITYQHLSANEQFGGVGHLLAK